VLRRGARPVADAPARARLAGVATHYMPSTKMHVLHKALEGARGRGDVIGATISQFCEDVYAGGTHAAAAALHCVAERSLRAEPFSLSAHMDTINECFSGDSVEAIMEALKAADTEFSRKTLEILQRMSPTALKVVPAARVDGATER
jgi:hypothetical protein